MSRLFQITDEDITTKTKFIKSLRRFLSTGKLPSTGDPNLDDDREYRPSRGELLLVDAIAKYFEEHTEITDKDLGINWFVDLHKHLVEAFEEFRTHPKHEMLRSLYKSQVGELNWEIPDLLDIRGGHAHGHVVYDLVKLLPRVAGRMGGSWLESDLKSYFDAEASVIDHAWKRFVRKCYRPIAHRIKEERHRGNSGLFGRTTLRSYVLAGRIMFTFARSNKLPDLTMLDQITGVVETPGADADSKLAAIEALLLTRQSVDSAPDAHQISFVGDDSDMYGFRAGMNYPSAGYAECVAMIEDVIAHWNPDKFVEDDGVSLG